MFFFPNRVSSFAGCQLFGNCIQSLCNSFAKVLLDKLLFHCKYCPFNATVGQIFLRPTSRRYVHGTVLYGHEQNNTVLTFGISNTPLVVKRGCKVGGGLFAGGLGRGPVGIDLFHKSHGKLKTSTGCRVVGLNGFNEFFAGVGVVVGQNRVGIADSRCYTATTAVLEVGAWVGECGGCPRGGRCGGAGSGGGGGVNGSQAGKEKEGADH